MVRASEIHTTPPAFREQRSTFGPASPPSGQRRTTTRITQFARKHDAFYADAGEGGLRGVQHRDKRREGH